MREQYMRNGEGFLLVFSVVDRSRFVITESCLLCFTDQAILLYNSNLIHNCINNWTLTSEEIFYLSVTDSNQFVVVINCILHVYPWRFSVSPTTYK